jgi:hypothetical protein
MRRNVVAHNPASGSIAFDFRTNVTTSRNEIARTSQVRSKATTMSSAQKVTTPANKQVQKPKIDICSLEFLVCYRARDHCALISDDFRGILPDLQYECPQASDPD